jgi:hypothetical protein
MGLIGELISLNRVFKANVSGTMLMIRLKLWTDYTGRFISGEISTQGKTRLVLTRDRPSPNRDSPFSMISNDPADIQAMKQAERYGKLVMLSDWDHLTGKEYMKALEESGYDILCV